MNSTLLIVHAWRKSRWNIRPARLILILRSVGLSTGLQSLLANHAAAIYLCGDRFEATLLIGWRRIENDRSTDGLWTRSRRGLTGWLWRLRNVDGSRRHFRGPQRERERASLIVDRDTVARRIVTAYHKTVTVFIQPRP